MFTNVIDCKDTNLFGIDAELVKNYSVGRRRRGEAEPPPKSPRRQWAVQAWER